MFRVRIGSLLILGVGVGCRLPAPATNAKPDVAGPILVTERSDRGGTLVFLDESGDRTAELVSESGELGPLVRDAQAAFSPDGGWVVFASSRGQRSLERSAIFVAPVRAGAVATQLTDGPGDLDPTWSPDGRSLLFVRLRGSGADVWKQSIELTQVPRLIGEPSQVAGGPGHQLGPSASTDGRIAFAELTEPGGDKRSIIRVLDAEGVELFRTAGPADSGPRFSPDGTALVFSRPTARIMNGTQKERRQASVDADLWIRDARGERKLWNLPHTDEGGPAFSVDGRWLFCTSWVRGADGSVVIASIVYADLWERGAPTVRMLRDRAGVWNRMSPAAAPVVLDSAALAAGPEYQRELERVIARAIDKAMARTQVAPGERPARNGL